MKKNILLLGAGKSSGALVRYLAEHGQKNGWHLVVTDQSDEAARQKTAGMEGVSAMVLDIRDSARLRNAIVKSSLVVSLLPAHLHVEVARMCVELGIHMATASYVSEGMQALHEEASRRGVILLNECGLDPGLDHMSAMALVDDLKKRGGVIRSFRSYTGGLVAPSSNDNPWGYKFSWNPRNVILAGQGTARYMEDGHYKYIPYHRLFAEARTVEIHHDGASLIFDGYANRDSLSYRKTYGLDDVPTLFRGTLRQQHYCRAWQVFVDLGLTDDSYVLEKSAQLTYMQWVESCLPPDEQGGTVREKLSRFLGIDPSDTIFRMVEWTGLLEDAPIGIDHATPAMALQKLLESKWKLRPTDCDMIVMQHEIRYTEGPPGNEYEIRSSLVLEGEDAEHTAMARTVGLPLAIACRLILESKIARRGCIVPVFSEIYRPILEELRSAGIVFHETRHAVSLSL